MIYEKKKKNEVFGQDTKDAAVVVLLTHYHRVLI